MEQPPFDEDNGIWTGWGWSYLELNHPRDFKFWMSFVETRDYQGPINGYVPEYFNWVDPQKISGGAFGETLENYGDNFGSFATKGSEANYGNANEYYVTGTLKVSDDLYYVPLPKFPSVKEREYLLAHPQSATQASMAAYSSALIDGSLANALIPTEHHVFDGIYQSTHQRLKIIEDRAGEEYRYIVNPDYRVGFDGHFGFVDWNFSNPDQSALTNNQTATVTLSDWRPSGRSKKALQRSTQITPINTMLRSYQRLMTCCGYLGSAIDFLATKSVTLHTPISLIGIRATEFATKPYCKVALQPLMFGTSLQSSPQCWRLFKIILRPIRPNIWRGYRARLSPFIG
jgi:hypothetical protein